MSAHVNTDSWSRDSWDVDPRLMGIQQGSDGNDTLVSMVRRLADLQQQLDSVLGNIRDDSAALAA